MNGWFLRFLVVGKYTSPMDPMGYAYMFLLDNPQKARLLATMTFKASRPTDWSDKQCWKIWLMIFFATTLPENQHIPWKLMVGRWIFLFKWSLFQLTCFFLRRVFQEELYEVDWCHFSDLLEDFLTTFDWYFFWSFELFLVCFSW